MSYPLQVWLAVAAAVLLLPLLGSGCGSHVSAPSARDITPAVSTTPAELVVDPEQRLGSISPYVFGTNYGPWMNISLGLWPQLEAAGLTYLRFPGGNWGDEHDLSGEQIDAFMELARRSGAEPAISVRLRGGSPESAARVVSYTNITRGYRVRFWSIGNEPSLYPDYDTARYNREWRAFAQAMRAVDPHILLIGPDTHQYTGDPASDPVDAAGRSWLREFLIANGDLVDIVAIHRYPFPAGTDTPPLESASLLANSREWDTIIPELRREIRVTTGRDYPVAVTEVNSHWTDATGGEATPDSFYNAIWWADVLGRLIRQRVDIVAHFALQTDTPNGGWGLFGESTPRPTYSVYQLYRQFGRELVSATTNDTDVSVYAALRADGRLTIIVINMGHHDTRPFLRFGPPGTSGLAEIWRLDTRQPGQKIGELTLASGDPIYLPAHSVSLYVVSLNPTVPTMATPG